MFDIQRTEDGSVAISGRLDASQAARLKTVLDTITGPCTLDFAGLEYISSAGLGILLSTQKRLSGTGHGLRLVNLNKHIKEVFTVAGFHFLFDIK